MWLEIRDAVEKNNESLTDFLIRDLSGRVPPEKLERFISFLDQEYDPKGKGWFLGQRLTLPIYESLGLKLSFLWIPKGQYSMNITLLVEVNEILLEKEFHPTITITRGFWFSEDFCNLFRHPNIEEAFLKKYPTSKLQKNFSELLTPASKEYFLKDQIRLPSESEFRVAMAVRLNEQKKRAECCCDVFTTDEQYLFQSMPYFGNSKEKPRSLLVSSKERHALDFIKTARDAHRLVIPIS